MLVGWEAKFAGKLLEKVFLVKKEIEEETEVVLLCPYVNLGTVAAIF